MRKPNALPVRLRLQLAIGSVRGTANRSSALPSGSLMWGGILALSLTMFSGRVVAQEASPAARPQTADTQNAERPENLPEDINASFLDPDMDVDAFIQRFEIESREVFAGRQDIVEAMRIEPGMTVADVGAGTGLFMTPLANAVGEQGRMLAVDIAPKFIKHLRQRARDEELPQVEVVLCSDRDANLPANKVDRVLICDVYHHFEYPRQSMASIHRAMKPGAELVLVDFHNDAEGERGEWLKNHVRAPKEVFQREVIEAGFELIEEVDIENFEENYLLRFRKP